jgi:hypothetical protein
MSKHHGRSATLAKSTPKAPAPTRAQPVETVPSPNGADHGTAHEGSTEEAIRTRAYQKWEGAGRPEGDGVSFWLDAERELKNSSAH